MSSAEKKASAKKVLDKEEKTISKIQKREKKKVASFLDQNSLDLEDKEDEKKVVTEDLFESTNIGSAVVNAGCLMDEHEKPPRLWTEDERVAWIQKNDSILSMAVSPFRKTLKVTGMEYEDLKQIAYEVAIRCFDKYDSSRSNKLSTYVFRSISNELNSQLRAASSKKRVGDLSLIHFSDIISTNEWNEPGVEKNPETTDFSRFDSLHTVPLSLEDTVMHRTLVDAVNVVLRNYFNPMEREVFRRLTCGESQSVVSANMNIPQSKVCSIQRRVRTRVMAALFRDGYIVVSDDSVRFDSLLRDES